MPLNYVTLVLDLYDGAGNPVLAGTAELTPSVQLTDTADSMLITQAPVPGVFRAGSFPQVKLLATDNGALAPAGWGWTITFSGVPGTPPGFSFFLPYSGGTTQYLSSLPPVSSVVTMAAYLPLKYTPGAAAGYVWTADADGNGSWEPPELPSADTPLPLLEGGTGVSAASTAALLADLGISIPPSGDTSGARDTAAIQAALNSASHTCQLTAGSYYVTGLTAVSYCTLAGAGAGLTIINVAGSGVNGITGTDLRNVTIRDLSLTASFSIKSTVAGDTSTIAYTMLEPG